MNISISDITCKINEAVAIAAATPNQPEAKLRELVAPLWDEYIRSNRINLNFNPRDERQLANGRADTVFNRLILEYKKPGVIKANNEKNRQLITQVKGYIEDLAKEERWKEERLLGVAFDGNYFLFVRKVGRWIEEQPLPVSAESVERFLLTLEKLTTKAALVPDNLIRDFAIGTGSLNYIASNAIKAFYFTLCSNVNDRVKVFFKQWALQFSEVHGAIENKKFNAETLFKSYGFKKDEQKDLNFLAFFFALDTYYGLLMKLLAYQVVGFYTLKNVAGLPLAEWEKLDTISLKEKLDNLEEGGIFRSLGIRNFLEGDLLSWYLNDWNEGVETAIRAIIDRLNQYDPETMELIPDETRDILKKLYQFLVPKQIRHDLGEYYTPDWLAERCLNQVGYGPKEPTLLQKRLLDPGCGSATFLILAIKRAKEHARLNAIPPHETINQITKNIVGFELNPLAVIAARTNYLLAIADMLKYKTGELTIPVYLCDSINPPQARMADEMTLFEEKLPYEVRTSVGNFYFPHEVVTRQGIQKLVNLMEDGVKNGQSIDIFLQRVKKELALPEDDVEKTDAVLIAAYDKLLELEERGINGIWSRIIKNAFAPLMYQNQFDIIIGNPPWVNWEALPQEYRDATTHIWKRYNLFEHTGLRARLGSAKDDISVLMTYVSIDKYLKDEGKLCIVITQTLFKTVGGGEGFRRFRLGNKGIPFKVLQVDDMVDLQPFDSATNKTSVFFCQKGQETSYPVEYHLWRKNGKGSIGMDMTWQEVTQKTQVSYFKAESVDGSEQGAWITARPKAIKAIKKVMAPSYYKAREGSSGGLNSVYLLKPFSSKGRLLQVANFTENAKKKVKRVEAFLEPDLVFPTLRGREIVRWQAKPELAIVLPQDQNKPSNGMHPQTLEKKYPKTFEYLESFKTDLENRSILKQFLHNQPYYSMYNTGQYSFAPYKVVWTRVGNNMKCAVVGDREQEFLTNRVVTPIETVVFVPFEDINEAHFFCALLNSSICSFAISSYSNKGTGSFGSPHVLEHIAITRYDMSNETQKELSGLSKQCHEKVAAGISVSDLENKIDELAAELWGLTKEELKDIKESLEEMR
ncbi:MAG: Eco57I restriction-modification methylase domain-containing protein [Candidatus Zhuqueibacterota bacterium]